MTNIFKERKTVEQVEEGYELAPKFDENGLMPVVTTDAKTGDVLMLGYQNEEAVKLTIQKHSIQKKCMGMRQTQLNYNNNYGSFISILTINN